MSTHNIGFYEDLTKIIFELSSNIIKYAPYFFCCVTSEIGKLLYRFSSCLLGYYYEGPPPLIIRWLEPANLFVIVIVKALWTMGFFLPIWNKIQNLEMVFGSFRWGHFGQFFVVSALIDRSFRAEF